MARWGQIVPCLVYICMNCNAGVVFLFTSQLKLTQVTFEPFQISTTTTAPRHDITIQHILQFACSKAGLILYSLDPNPELAKQDPTKAKEALAKALELTNATILISQEAGDDVNYITLCEGVVPEIRIFDFSEGCQFFTPRYPHLRFPVHTGYTCTDNEGMFLFRHFLVPSNNLDALLRGTGCKALDGKTPLLGELVYGKDGVPTKIGKVLTNEEVFKAKDTWVQFSSILSREYQEVPGVGVVF